MPTVPEYLKPLVESSADARAVEDWIEAHPEQLGWRSSDHVLHYVLSRSSWSPMLVLKLIRAAPWALAVPTKAGNLPIHIALYNRSCPLDVVEALVEGHRMSLLVRGSHDRNPLSVALYRHRRGDEEDIVDFLVDKTPAEGVVAACHGFEDFYEESEILHSVIARICKSRRDVLEQLRSPMDLWRFAVGGYVVRGRQYVMDVTSALGDLFDASHTFQDGTIPIFLALRYQSAFELIALILRLNPECVKQRAPDTYSWCHGGFPLHAAVDEVQSRATIKLLLDRFPEALAMQNYRGETPLHLLRSVHSFDFADVPECRLALQVRDCQGRLPLHRSVQCQSALRHVIRLYPEALHVRDAQGLTPIHACMENADDESAVCCIYLVERYPECAALRDSQGRLPLHILASKTFLSGGTADINSMIDCLMDYYPDGMEALDNNGDTPLHIAFKSSAHPDVFMSLLSSESKTFLRIADRNGDYPLGLALERGLWEMAMLVVDMDPAVVGLHNSPRCGDAIHRRLLHAMDHGDTLRWLWEASSKAATLRGSGERTLLHVACARREWHEHIPWMLGDASALTVEDSDRNLPLHYFMSTATSASWGIVGTQLVANDLAWTMGAKNHEGLSPLEVALRKVGYTGDGWLLEDLLVTRDVRFLQMTNDEGDPALFRVPWNRTHSCWRSLRDLLCWSHRLQTNAIDCNLLTGETLLHRLIRWRAPDGLVVELLRQGPTLHASVSACGGWLPLHLYVAYMMSKEDSWTLPPALPDLERPRFLIPWLLPDPDAYEPPPMPPSEVYWKSDVYSEVEYRLLQAYPPAAATLLPDGRTPLWMMAAAGDCALTTLYCILKEAPELLSRRCDSS